MRDCPLTGGRVGRVSAQHWDGRYESIGEEAVGWFEKRPDVSLEMLSALGVSPSDSIIDVGGGASRLVDHLVAAGHQEVTVLDVSQVAVDADRRRVGERAEVTWVVEDVLAWTPPREWDVWHDRMLLHFLVADEQRAAYLSVLRRALTPRGAVVICTFAEDGPEGCSALPVRRHSREELSSFLGADVEVVEARRVVHMTPGGVQQSHNWIAGRLRAA
jgi:SAM-dependent methyltransferase